MKLKLTVEWLIEQGRTERAILGGHVSPDTHDSAYAHALMMAMAQVEDESFGHWRECVQWIKRRAAELMREWGYTED